MSDQTEREDELARLRQWKAEATEVILGLQDLGKALRLPLGERITGTAAAEAAERLTARVRELEAALQQSRDDHQGAEDQLRDYEHRIAWDTTCGQCATTLDNSIREYERAELAVEKLRAVEGLADELGNNVAYTGYARGQRDACARIRAALASPVESDAEDAK